MIINLAGWPSLNPGESSGFFVDMKNVMNRHVNRLQNDSIALNTLSLVYYDKYISRCTVNYRICSGLHSGSSANIPSQIQAAGLYYPGRFGAVNGFGMH